MDEDKKVEYKFLRTKDEGWFTVSINFDEMERKLNRLGQEGWDVVTSLDINSGQGGTKEVVLLLKRYI
jgi:hypothetical protein